MAKGVLDEATQAGTHVRTALALTGQLQLAACNELANITALLLSKNDSTLARLARLSRTTISNGSSWWEWAQAWQSGVVRSPVNELSGAAMSQSLKEKERALLLDKGSEGFAGSDESPCGDGQAFSYLIVAALAAVVALCICCYCSRARQRQRLPRRSPVRPRYSYWQSSESNESSQATLKRRTKATLKRHYSDTEGYF